MNLTDREKRMLDGDFGTGPQSAMRLLATLGEIYGAERMIPVSSCHVGGRSYLISGEENIEWMTDLLNGRGPLSSLHFHQPLLGGLRALERDGPAGGTRLQPAAGG